MEITVLDWDSVFFKKPVAKIVIAKNEIVNAAALLNTCRQRLFKLVYLFVDGYNHTAVTELSKLAGLPVNTKIVFTTTAIKLENFKCLPVDTVVIMEARSKQKNLESDLLKLAVEAGAFSRFKKDKKIDAGLFLKMYSLWISNIIKDKKNTRILTAVTTAANQKEVSGFLAYKSTGSNFKIEFIAIDKKWQGKGIGKALVKTMMQQAAEKNIHYINVETQEENIEACAFYTACGFTIAEAIKIFHVHL